MAGPSSRANGAPVAKDLYPEMADPRIQTMARLIVPETSCTLGDNTDEWNSRAVIHVWRIIGAEKNQLRFYEAITQGPIGRKTACVPARNAKLPETYGRVGLFNLKLFRFSCLKDERQITNIRNCKHKYVARGEIVCLNPWHYNFLKPVTEKMAPIMVTRGLDYGAPPIRMRFPFNEQELMENILVDEEVDVPISNVTLEGDELGAFFKNKGDTLTMEQMEQEEQEEDESTPVPSPQRVSSMDIEGQEELEYYRCGSDSPGGSNAPTPRAYVNDGYGEDEDMEGVEEKKKNEESISNETNQPNTPMEVPPLFRSAPSEIAEFAHNVETHAYVEYEENTQWLGLAYYEEGAIQAAAVFSGQHALIDGYTSSGTPTRFSIGFYNSLTRRQNISVVRNEMQRGIRLYLLAGEVFLENLSAVGVFVQSVSSNLSRKFRPNTVTKVRPGGTMKIFDLAQFSKSLALAAQKTYQDVSSLNKLCTIRVAMSEGWGVKYHRSTVLSSPVWFQLYLHNPMAWIDNVLNCMGAPAIYCDSRT
ncbi:hypothetical protein B9Z55_002320 [Caenorhabditis nigoni]|uniref:Uncharacterized protein n=1 Tax=Caenorhabditis nigoni TaxID=1611254 RepID=A0A2G5VJT1_9PELO|nr:hypothetical protein B9Z55_002320 [Caenorhabditis nigoni]